MCHSHVNNKWTQPSCFGKKYNGVYNKVVKSLVCKATSTMMLLLLTC